MALLTAGAAQAQTVLGYSVTQSDDAYTALSSPTVIFDASTVSGDANFDLEKALMTPDGIKSEDGTYGCYDLGFDINIAGETFSKFAVSGSGYVFLSNGDVDYRANMTSNFLTFGEGYTIAGMTCQRGMQSGADTQIAYQVTGTGTDRCLTVQFTKIGVMTTFWGEATVFPDYQLKLYEDGRMQLVFNNFDTMEDSDFFQLVMGIRADDNFVCATGEPGALGISRNRLDNVSYRKDTANGTIVTFNVPVDCVKPASQPTDLKLDVSSTVIEGEFTPCEGADTYLLVYSTGDNVPAVPADQTTYSEGDKIGDNTTVACFGSDTDFQLRDLAGSTKYNFAVYAANAYGLNGPVYNVTDPLAATVKTAPIGPQSVEIGASTLSSISMTVKSNENDDNVVILYTPFCQRSDFGDHGLFGKIPADVKAGDVLPVPEDYNPDNLYPGEAPATDGGTVAYVGKATEEPIVISGLNASTMYYVSVWTMDADGDVCVDNSFAGSRQVINTGSFTVIENPWDGNSASFPRYSLPYGWQTAAEDSGEPYFRDEDFVDFNGELMRGTQAIQQRVQIQRGDAVNGKTVWMALPPVDVSERHVTVDFSYSIVEGLNRFSSQGYNKWAEGDEMQILVSDDEGQSWTPVATYTAENNPQQKVPEGMEVDEQRGEAYYTQFGYVNISADLNEYRGKTVLVKLYFKTFATPGFGMNMYVDRVSVKQADFPEVPEVNVVKITDSSATVNWTSAQTDYQLQYGEVGGDSYTTVNVKGAMTYTLTGLEANTEYEVKVRGLLADGENYSEWSDMVNFKTADYPAVDAPENLKSDVETLASVGYVLLSWDKVPQAEKYEVAYRLSSATEWIYQESDEASAMLTELEDGQTYVWKVRAFCTHDRETAYSAQARFVAPTVVGIDAIEGDDAAAEYYTLQGVRVDNPEAGQVYIVRRGNKVTKEIAR